MRIISDFFLSQFLTCSFGHILEHLKKVSLIHDQSHNSGPVFLQQQSIYEKCYLWLYTDGPIFSFYFYLIFMFSGFFMD